MQTEVQEKTICYQFKTNTNSDKVKEKQNWKSDTDSNSKCP